MNLAPDYCMSDTDKFSVEFILVFSEGIILTLRFQNTACCMKLSLCISYCPHCELPEQRSRAQPEIVRGQPAFPRSLMSVNARVV